MTREQFYLAHLVAVFEQASHEAKPASLLTPAKETHMVKRWVGRPVDDRMDVPHVDAFLKDILAVFRKHRLELSHEDHGGAFVVRMLTKAGKAWVNQASVDAAALKRVRVSVADDGSTPPVVSTNTAIEDIRPHVPHWIGLMEAYVASLPPDGPMGSGDADRSFAEHELHAMKRDLGALIGTQC